VGKPTRRSQTALCARSAARPRLGYGVDIGAVHALPYVTGGLTVTDLTYRENTTVLRAPTTVETARFAKAYLVLLRHIRSLGTIFGRGAAQHGHRDRRLARATTR
jgi:hypothetical protein